MQMPLNAATKTFAILAKKGAGKTYTAAVMAEEFFKNNIPFVVFDPIDVWWGLRLDKNGKDKGLPVVVFGLEHSDIKLDRDMGKRIAQAVVNENISCIISTFGMPKVAERHLIAEFSEEILRINNTPRHIFIEEAHEFVPQRVFGGISKTFNNVSNLVVMGGNRRLGVTLINQRAATVNKDVLTQLDTLLAFQNTSPQDRKALKEWVEFHSAEGDFNKFMDSLPSLPKGEGWIWSPEFLGIFQKIKIRKRETFHPDREKASEDIIVPPLVQVDVQSFIQKFNSKASEKTEGKETKKAELGKISYFDEKKVQAEKQEIINMRNDYENQLTQKDIQIRDMTSRFTKINDILAQIMSLSLGNLDTDKLPSSGNTSSAVQMWLDKLGSGGPSKILKFLSENPSGSYTRQQITLAIGAKYSSVKNVWVPLLKRNLLIKDEAGHIRINPDL